MRYSRTLASLSVLALLALLLPLGEVTAGVTLIGSVPDGQDSYGLAMDWFDLRFAAQNSGEGPDLIRGLQESYDSRDYLYLEGDTQEHEAKKYIWTIDDQEAGRNRILELGLEEAGIGPGEHRVIFRYMYYNSETDEDVWVISREAVFHVRDEGPSPEQILGVFFLILLLVIIRRRRKRRRARKAAQKVAAQTKVIHRAPAAPSLEVPQRSLYDGGKSPYAVPPKATRLPRAKPMDPTQATPQRIPLKPKSAKTPLFHSSLPQAKAEGQTEVVKEKVELKSAINYEKAHIIYKIKVENNTDTPLAEVRVRPFAPANLFKVDREERTIGLIQPRQAQTATFKLRPRGECGNVSLQAKVTYYDTATNKYAELDAKPKETAIICPMLKYEEIDEQEWRRNVAGMLKVEETTDQIALDGESLFSMVTDVFADLNLNTVTMNVDRGRVFRGRALFWAKGAVAAKGLGYATQVEVIGGELRSKLILKAFAKGEDSLVGFYHSLLDEIEKRTAVRDYLDEGVTVQHIYGDMVSGAKVDIRDSVLQRSQIATEGDATAPARGKAGGPADLNAEVKGDRVEGSKVDIQDSIVTRSQVGSLGEERIAPLESGLEEGVEKLRRVVEKGEEQ